MALPTAIPERNWVNIQWLARLRWAEIAGQAGTVLIGQFLLDGALPIASLLLVISLGLVSNLGLELYFFGDRRRETPSRTVHEWQIALVMMLDVAILTGLLYLTGGPHNPFGLLYVVQIALATVLLRAKWAWLLGGLSFLGFGVLLMVHQPLWIAEDNLAIGLWAALGVASAFVVHFLQRIIGALSEREAELTKTRGLAARQERLASLATMAAGAAHELSTPLGTVALAAKELERALTKAGASTDALHLELAADARLIREQVGRCRAILEHMAQGAGTVGESVAASTVGELLEEAMVGIRPAPTIHRDMPGELGRWPVRLPPRAVSQALRSLFTNAQDASSPNAAVVVAVRRAGTTLSISIRDRGAGMPSEVMARIGEPFFTTKAPGRGMGLGLFLARAVIEGVGGTLEIESMVDQQGTEVLVTLPTDVSPRDIPVARSDEPRAAPVVSKPA
ncbi:MAG: integral rane sensor signal transduction histidine kinase [Deltaproteobacteria bacterium]|nr:integral rane sensor signal transduction histidine kinase [Deltaproteobacteria bacterium]